MRAIRIDNPTLTSYLTDLLADYDAGNTSLSVRSNNSFSANDLIVVGKPTEELTEEKKINSITGNQQLDLASTLKFSHNKGTPVYKSLWDFISIEGNPSASGAWSVLSLSPIQWDSESNKTIYLHDAGDNNYRYRFRFYNSILQTYSEYSPTLTGAGFEPNQMGYIIREARKLAGDKEGRVLTTDELLRSASRAKNIIKAKNSRYWFWKVNGFNSGVYIETQAGVSVYSLEDIEDMGVIDTIEYRFTQNNEDQKYVLEAKGDVDFLSRTRNLNRANRNYPSGFRTLPKDANSSKGYIELDNKILSDGTGKLYLNYWKKELDYDSVDDITDIDMPEILQDYLIAEIYAAKGNDTMAKKYYDLFSGPEGREKTLPLDKLSGIALLDELDKQNKRPQGNPSQLWNYQGQRGARNLYGRRYRGNTDQDRENFFRDER